MEKSTKMFKGYYRCSKTQYADKNEPISIMIGMYHPEGGGQGEFKIVWEELGKDIVPRLKAYDDSWGILASMKDLLKGMTEADDKNITEVNFCLLLDSLGYRDITDYGKNRVDDLQDLVDRLHQIFTTVYAKGSQTKTNNHKKEEAKKLLKTYFNLHLSK